uniref:Uncharacterized protein n=1 Tax=Ciona intestinalis TaxID=7719 RepID=H2XTU7_CIOIN
KSGENETRKHILPNISKFKIPGGFGVIPRISTSIPLLLAFFICSNKTVSWGP